jgi:hypothetical protein
MPVNRSGVTTHLYWIGDPKGIDDWVTSVVCDPESFEWVWGEIERCRLVNLCSGGPADLKVLAKIRACKRLPLIRKTPRTEHIFAALGVSLTDVLVGIVRGAGKIPLNLDD